MPRIIVTVCCAIALLAACGGDESSPTDTPTADATTTTAANGSDAGVIAIETPPCDLVTSDDVATATGLAVGDATEQPPLSCIFPVGDDSGVDVYVNADDGAGRGSGPAAVFAAYEEMVAEGSAEAVTGLGEAAFYSQGFRTLAVNAGGGQFIAVGVNGGFSELDEPRDALIAIATAAIGRI
ncbi:DUF3558 family protein [Actinomycetota bacterium]